MHVRKCHLAHPAGLKGAFAGLVWLASHSFLFRPKQDDGAQAVSLHDIPKVPCLRLSMRLSPQDSLVHENTALLGHWQSKRIMTCGLFSFRKRKHCFAIPVRRQSMPVCWSCHLSERQTVQPSQTFLEGLTSFITLFIMADQWSCSSAGEYKLAYSMRSFSLQKPFRDQERSHNTTLLVCVLVTIYPCLQLLDIYCKLLLVLPLFAEL